MARQPLERMWQQRRRRFFTKLNMCGREVSAGQKRSNAQRKYTAERPGFEVATLFSSPFRSSPGYHQGRRNAQIDEVLEFMAGTALCICWCMPGPTYTVPSPTWLPGT